MEASAPPDDATGAPRRGLLKQLEIAFKHLIGWLLAWVAFSPRRSARVRKLLAESKRVVLMRLDERVGEALMTTPLIEALFDRGYEVTVVVHPKCARVLDGHPKAKRVIPFDRRRWWLLPLAPGVRALHPVTRGAVVVNCSSWSEYSGTPALISRFASPNGCVVGPKIGPAGELADEAVPALTDTTSELRQRLSYLSPLDVEAEPRMSFRPPRETEAVRAFAASLQRPYVVVNPGGRLGWRRVPAEVFKAACLELRRLGHTPVVTWGPGEEPLARQTAPEGAVVAPPTDLDELAALMKGAELTVCNNTGPMHLSVAVGTRTLALFLHMPVERWGHGPPHVMVDLTPARASAEAMGAKVAAEIRALLPDATSRR